MPQFHKATGQAQSVVLDTLNPENLSMPPQKNHISNLYGCEDILENTCLEPAKILEACRMVE